MENQSHYLEVLARLEGLKELLNTKFDNNDLDHIRIIGRMDTANGRTTKNENKISALENWRWYILGLGSVVVLIINIIINKYL
jgi:hypothetical protein